MCSLHVDLEVGFLSLRERSEKRAAALLMGDQGSAAAQPLLGVHGLARALGLAGMLSEIRALPCKGNVSQFGPPDMLLCYSRFAGEVG